MVNRNSSNSLLYVVECVFGTSMVVHGLNGIYEGSAGIFNGVVNEIDSRNRDIKMDGPLRKLYQSGAEAPNATIKFIGLLVFRSVNRNEIVDRLYWNFEGKSIFISKEKKDWLQK